MSSAPSAAPGDATQPSGEAQLIERAIAAYRRRDWGDAEKLCRAVLAANPNHVDALHLLGTIVVQTRSPQEAAELLARAAELRPADAEILATWGVALRDCGRYADAVASYDRAIAVAPNYAEAHANRGVALRNLELNDEALQSYDRAIATRPDFVQAYANRAMLLAEIKRYPEALESYKRALQIQPDYPYLYGSWVHAKMQICDWSRIESQYVRLAGKIERGERAATPWQILATPCSAALQRRAAEIAAKDRFPYAPAARGPLDRPAHERIRIGYFSADFHEHATAHLIAELFERHDRAKFELTAYSFGPTAETPMRRRLMAAFDNFVDVRDRSDQDVALLAIERETDIAVDLKGFSQSGRPGIFARRAAPIQVSFLGYPGTMGADYFDYLIADSTLVPEGDQRHYVEKIAYMPESYQVNDTQRTIPDAPIRRADLRLPEEAFVFCCFNNSYKITPAMFDRWMRVLLRVQGSVLWLLHDNEWAEANLRREAHQRGVAAERLIFAPRIPLPGHLARHRAADLFLDTLPCNAHTTASDALWAGLPLVTCQGETFAGRVAASLLRSIRLPELVARTPADYEALAIELATNPAKLREIRERLAHNRFTQPLFDIASYTRALERGYAMMYERHRAGLRPEHISVPR
ncbi:MAG TPA: tetratricopeptide repeat protein [Casimicrobiaceae bacterium]|nr:tetratricopeptide repeat protein [Casimicrobiaceae bacterium]